MRIKRKGIKKGNKKKKLEKPSYRGIPCDSYAEVYTLMWIFELEKNEYVKVGSIERSKSYLLFDAVSRTWVENLKTKSNSKIETLLAGHLYTPDFVFTLTDKGKQLALFTDINGSGRLRIRRKFNLIHQDGVVHIETKGTYFRTADDTTEKFSVDKKWLWEKHKVYVNLFQCDKVFPLTWTPEEFKITDKTKQPRKIRWKVRDIYSYIKTL